MIDHLDNCPIGILQQLERASGCRPLDEQVLRGIRKNPALFAHRGRVLADRRNWRLISASRLPGQLSGMRSAPSTMLPRAPAQLSNRRAGNLANARSAPRVNIGKQPRRSWRGVMRLRRGCDFQFSISVGCLCLPLLKWPQLGRFICSNFAAPRQLANAGFTIILNCFRAAGLD